MSADTAPPRIELRDVALAYGDFVLIEAINAVVRQGQIFVVMGGSGCGKSTLLRQMTGLKATTRGAILYDGDDFVAAPPERRAAITRTFGVMFQSGALWSSMTLAENVALPLGEFTALSPREIDDLVRLKLSYVGLSGFEEYYPAEISGGMCKRASIARAIALDADILFLDEPSAGLDPVSSARLDELLRRLRDTLGTTLVVVTHELPSIFAIADHAIFLDPTTRSVRAQGNPRDLARDSTDPVVREFLTRGGAVTPAAHPPAKA